MSKSNFENIEWKQNVLVKVKTHCVIIKIFENILKSNITLVVINAKWNIVSAAFISYY